MSKSAGNVTAPQTIIKDAGADILRLWVAASDYSDDMRIGPEILKTFVETYRKLRNTIRWMLGSLAHYDPANTTGFEAMGELERLMLHRLAELDGEIRDAYGNFDYKRVVARLTSFPQHRSFGLLFRHSQGHALLRTAFERKAARRAVGDRADFPLRYAMARAGPGLHFGRGVARALSRRDLGASRKLSRFRPRGATKRLPKNGNKSAASVPSSPARWRSSGRKSASAPRLRRRQGSLSRTRACARFSKQSISPKSVSPRISRSRLERGQSALSGSTASKVSPFCRPSPRGENVRDPGEFPRSLAAILNFPM